MKLWMLKLSCQVIFIEKKMLTWPEEKVAIHYAVKNPSQLARLPFNIHVEVELTSTI